MLKVATELQWPKCCCFFSLDLWPHARPTSRFCGQVPVEVHYQIV